jgi:hypothetical protein
LRADCHGFYDHLADLLFALAALEDHQAAETT